PFQQSIENIKALRAELEKVSDPMSEAFDPERVEALNAAITRTTAGVVEGFAGATAQALSSIQSMSEEGSRSYEAMELAIQAANIAAGIAAIVNQGMGDPYTAIPRMAAMAV